MLYILYYFLGGAFFVNGLPHLLNGTSGRAFPTPFARLRGQRESPALLNVLWGAFNFVAGYALLFQAGSFDIRSAAQVIAAGAGGLLLGLFLAWRFGPFYGGFAMQDN
jgi:uncharacterized membrane protein YkvI